MVGAEQLQTVFINHFGGKGHPLFPTVPTDILLNSFAHSSADRWGRETFRGSTASGAFQFRHLTLARKILEDRLFRKSLAMKSFVPGIGVLLPINAGTPGKAAFVTGWKLRNMDSAQAQFKPGRANRVGGTSSDARFCARSAWIKFGERNRRFQNLIDQNQRPETDPWAVHRMDEDVQDRIRIS